MGMKITTDGMNPLKVKVKGLSRELEDINAKALEAGGLIIQKQAQEWVPVEYGNLKASAYTEAISKRTVEIGFTAEYAIYVHENMEQKLKGKPRPSGLGVYWGPQGRPKFLEAAVREKRDEAIAEMKRQMQKGIRDMDIK